MGFRHRRSFKIAPGVRINVGKKSASVTFGGKHTPHYTVNSKGRKTVSTKTPVKGVSYSKSWSSSSSSRKHNKSKSNYSSSKSSNSYYNNNNNYNETGAGSSMTIIDRVDAMRHNAKYRVNKLNIWSKNHKIGSVILLVVIAMISASLFYGNVINPEDSNDESCTNAICAETTEEATTRASLTRVEKETTTTTKESTTEEETTTRQQGATNTTTPTTTETPSTTSAPSTTAAPTTSAPTTEAPTTSTPATEAPTTEKSETVYVTPNGSKYHSRKCGKGTYNSIEKSKAIAAGYEPCGRCY